jgi:hypothetical protein
MRRVLFSLAAAAALASVPAFAQDGSGAGGAGGGSGGGSGGAPPPQSSNVFSNPGPYNGPYVNLPGVFSRSKACFNGSAIKGANRIGDQIVYVQGPRGAIFRLETPDGCQALKAAEKLTVRVAGQYEVCNGDRARLIVKTAAGAKSCKVAEVRHLTSTELAELKTSTAR